MITGIDSTAANNYQIQVTSKKVIAAEESKVEEKGGVSKYYERLCSKYPKLKITVNDYVCRPSSFSLAELSNGSDSVWGNVNLNYQYLQKASQDPQAAAHLEEILTGIPIGEAWMRNHAALDNTEITDNGTIIGPNGEVNGYMSSRMPAKNSNNTVDRQSKLDMIQEKNKAEVKRRENETGSKETKTTAQPIKIQDIHEVWESTSMQDNSLWKLEQERAETRGILEEERVLKMIQRSEAYEQQIQQTSSFDLHR